MKKYTLLTTIAAIIVAFDQLTKYFVQQKLALWDSENIIPGFFNLVFFTNKGAAFGFLNRNDFDWQPLFFLTATAVAIVLIFYLARSENYSDKLSRIGLGLLLGGATGNMIDRIYLGAVVDFLDFYINNHHWPAFNIADMAICTGVLCLLVTMYQRKKHAPRSF